MPFFFNDFIENSDIDPKVYRRIVGIFWIILLSVFVGVLLFECSKGECSKFYDSVDESYRGKVSRKYLNPNDHRNPTLEFEDGTVHSVNYFDTTGYFDFIEVGDSVIKTKGNLTYWVKRNTTLWRFEIEESDCGKYMK